MKKLLWSALVATLALVWLAAATGTPTTASAAGGGQVTFVQAVPGVAVDLRVDGRTVRRGAGVGSVVGPITLATGPHELALAGVPGGRPLTTRIEVAPGSGNDVVLHRPASVNGPLAVSSYTTPDDPIGPGKARLLLAHTATVAPADVSFDGTVVFRNIANGEYADADVPAGPHEVALLPTGATTDPILGPLTVDLAPRTATMVYAVGNPRDGSMDVVAHTLRLASDGTVVPRSIDTGSAGLATLAVAPPRAGPLDRSRQPRTPDRP